MNDDDVTYYRRQADAAQRHLDGLTDDQRAAYGLDYVARLERDLQMWRQLAHETACYLRTPEPDELDGYGGGPALF